MTSLISVEFEMLLPLWRKEVFFISFEPAKTQKKQLLYKFSEKFCLIKIGS